MLTQHPKDAELSRLGKALLRGQVTPYLEALLRGWQTWEADRHAALEYAAVAADWPGKAVQVEKMRAGLEEAQQRIKDIEAAIEAETN